jgi:hypothetical protein
MPYPDEPEPPRSEAFWAVVTILVMIALGALGILATRMMF